MHKPTYMLKLLNIIKTVDFFEKMCYNVVYIEELYSLEDFRENLYTDYSKMPIISYRLSKGIQFLWQNT